MPGKFLGQFDIPLGKIGHGDKIVTKIMDADKASINAGLLDAAFDPLLGIAFDCCPHAAGTDGFEFPACSDIVAGKYRL